MPRNYKPDPCGKRYRKYDSDLIQQALEEYRISQNKCSLASVAKKFNINKSVLYRHHKKTMKSQGGQNALDEETEKYIVQYLNICSNWGYPLDTYDLRIIVKLYVDNMGITHKRFNNNMPGPDFASRFLKRHKDTISIKMCQNIKKSRAKVSPEVINEYFEELTNSLENIDPKNIVNYDETNVSDDPGRKKVIVKRGTKYPERVLNQSKSSISIMMAGTAAGELLPPYVIYKVNNIYDTWTTGGPRGTRYNRTGSGWIDGNTFEDYIKTIVVPFFKDRPGKKVLIGDNLSSHLSLEVIRLCEEENISFIFLPANSTHLTQPLDIAFFRPMKIAWRNILAKWKKTDGRNQASVPKGCFPRLLKNLLNDLSVNVESNLKAGFRKAGIVPIDPEQVLSRLPKDDEDPDRNRYAVDKSVLEILKEMRYGTMNVKEPARKRKLNAETAKSLENIDDDNLESEPENKMTNKRHETCKKGSKNKKLQVIPGKAVHLDSKICDTVNNDIENIEPKNVLINEPMKKTTGEISRYKTKQIKEVKQLMEKLNNDLMKIDSSMKTETSLKKDDKNITDINLLPVVYVDEYTIAEKSQKDEKQLTNICNDFQQEDKLLLTNEYTIVNLFEKEDEELLIDNYIEPNASSIHYLPDIETDTNIFSAVCNNEEQENSLQNEEEKAKHQLIEVISSTEKNDKKEEKAKRKKIEIISSTVKIDKKVKLHNCKKIPIQSTINIKKEKSFKKTQQRHQYYKHDADILRYLTD